VTADPRDSDTPPAADAKPRLVIEWAGEGLAEVAIRPEGRVSMAQLYAAAWLLEAWTREVRAQQIVGDMARQIMAPPPGLAGQLGLGQRS
jgi:hypothetical protein